jgi:hypothetical protein
MIDDQTKRNLGIYLWGQHISHVAMRQSGTSAPANSRIWWVISSVSNNRDRKRSRDRSEKKNEDSKWDTSTVAKIRTISLGLSAWAFDWELSCAVKYYTSHASSNSQEASHLLPPLLGYLSRTSLVWSASQLFGTPSFRRFQNLDPFHGAVHEFYGSGTNVSQLRVNCASGEVLSQMMHEIIGVSNEPTGLEAERSSIFFLEHALILSSN